MLGELNEIRNSDFVKGVRQPRNWRWIAEGDGVDWRPVPTSGNGELAGVQVTSRTGRSRGQWSQAFRCRRNQHYRVEAVVSCDCTPVEAGGGLILSLRPIEAEGSEGDSVATAPIHRCERETLRAYYRTFDATHRLELRIGLMNASGWAAVHDVRVVAVMEPEFKSHPWALPPLPLANKAPLSARRICVVTSQLDRRLPALLQARFGPEAVKTCGPRDFTEATRDADAVFLPDARPPAACRTIKSLLSLAETRTVIVSSAIMESISLGRLATKTIRQIDDPLHGRVVHSNFVTGGLALHDIFPFAAQVDHSTEMTQRQFRGGKDFRRYLKKHGFEVMLDSVTDAESTSERPIALLRQTHCGAVVVMDVEPAESSGSSLDEPTVAVHMLLAALGAKQHAVGHYLAPARNAVEFFRHLCDIIDRFEALDWAGGLRPEEPESPCMITVGRDLDSVGLPTIPRPVIIIRTGLTGDDLTGAYGAMLWLKQMLRPPPFVSPYAKSLLGKFRIAWIPLAAPMATWGGWALNGEAGPFPVDAEFEDGAVAACIDVCGTDRHLVRVATPTEDGFSNLLAGALPPLSRQIVSGRHFYRAAPTGKSAGDRTAATWRTDDLSVMVQRNDRDFEHDFHRSAAAAGARLIRLELPTVHSEPFANSIWRSDWAALMLEQLVGLVLGTIVVNRDAEPLRFVWPAVLADLRERSVMRRVNEPDIDLPRPAERRGGLTIPAGHAIVAIR